MALERHGVGPSSGPVIVTGAAGGVGSVAISVLAKLGWEVIASTGRPAEESYLRTLGASDVIDRAELSSPARPLGKERWAAGVDAFGSHTLVDVLAQSKRNGAVAACGLAQGMNLPGSLAPFILRGVSLLGIDSVMCSPVLGLKAWQRLAVELERARLEEMTTCINFDEILEAAPRILSGEIRGRPVVAIA